MIAIIIFVQFRSGGYSEGTEAMQLTTFMSFGSTLFSKLDISVFKHEDKKDD